MVTPIIHAPAHDVIPDFIDGKPFSRTLGIGLLNVDYARSTEASLSGWWTVASAAIPPCAGSGLAVSSLSAAMRLAPTQTRVLTLELAIDPEPVPTNITELPIDIVVSRRLAGSPYNADDEQYVLRVSVPIRHVPMWTPTSYTAIRATYSVGFSNSTTFLVLPPRFPNDEDEGGPREPIIALRMLSFTPDRSQFS